MTRPPPNGIPAVLETSTTVAAARLTDDGALLGANEGFRWLLERADLDEHEAGDVLQKPSLEELTTEGKEWTGVHDGLLQVGPSYAGGFTLRGDVWSREGELLLIAEHDLEGLLHLQDRVLDLNEELSEAHRELARELRDRQRAEDRLEEKAEALERSNEALEQFASVVAHDLKEPLRTLQGYLNLFEKDAGEALPPDDRELLEEALATAGNMEELVDGLLEWSRVDTEACEPEPVDADTALDQALENLHAAVEESEAAIQRERLPRVRADLDQLVHLFQNLLSNAIKYAGEAPPRVEITVEGEAEDWVRVYVKDHGVGIPEDEQGSVLEVFRRGSTASGEGAGVGLSVCKRIVERHGGDLDLDSTPGEGTTFSFTLPAAA